MAAIMQRPRRNRGFAVVGFALTLFGLGLPFAALQLSAHYGPLDLSATRSMSTIVVDRQGQLLRAFTTADGRWRLPVEVRDVDPRYLALLESFEDRRFSQHHGVDWLAAARAGGQFLRHGRVISGASTLTMQVARLLEPRENRTPSAKLRQVFRALQLEQRFTKQQILEFYLTLAPMGGNLEGVRAASLSYFGKEPKHLTLAEAALLVALPQSPETRRPDRSPQAARRARDHVLERAVRHGVLSRADARAAEEEPIPIDRKPFPFLAAHAAEAAQRATPQMPVLALTLDRRLQMALEGLAKDGAEKLGAKLSVAIVAIDNASGDIRAHVGGADYFARERAGSIDMTQALRSPGSALKPFIYAMAFENGIAHPETLLEDHRARFGLYAPENFDLTFQGQVTARQALQLSLNVPAIELLNEVGPSRFLARLRNAGADVPVGGDAAPGLAVGLGGLGIRLMDLARLYAGLARGGLVPDLMERSDLARGPSRDLRITEPVAAWYVFDVLRGAPPPVNAVGGRIAYKTGTSYGYRDAFAIGYDKRTTIAIWVGRADNGAVPGLIGRQVAAPILFDAFARLGGEREPLAQPAHVLVATTANLPPPLRRLRRENVKTAQGLSVGLLKIAYPPDGARVDLGLSQVSTAQSTQAPQASLALKAQGGSPPFRWLVNGLPIGPADARRQASWSPDGIGFARVSVIDAQGTTASVTVRLE